MVKDEAFSQQLGKAPGSVCAGTLCYHYIKKNSVRIANGGTVVPGVTWTDSTRKTGAAVCSEGTAGDWTSTGSTTATHEVEGLVNGRTYRFRVRARNGTLVGPPSGEASATPVAPPSAPRVLRAEAGDGQAVLTWTVPVAGGTVGSPTGYEVRYKSGDGDYPATWTDTGLAGNGTRHAVSGLTNGTAHAFQLRATNAGGSSPASNEARATPAAATAVPGTPTGLAAAAGDGRRRRLLRRHPDLPGRGRDAGRNLCRDRQRPLPPGLPLQRHRRRVDDRRRRPDPRHRHPRRHQRLGDVLVLQPRTTGNCC